MNEKLLESAKFRERVVAAQMYGSLLQWSGDNTVPQSIRDTMKILAESHRLVQIDLKRALGTPYPEFCHHAEKCGIEGRCLRDPVCID